MFRNKADQALRVVPGRVSSRSRHGARLFLVLLALLPTFSVSAVTVPVDQGVELFGPVQRELDRIRSEWRMWEAAVERGDQAEAGRIADQLVASGEQLGLPRLPDLAAGAVAKAQEIARLGDVGQAVWVLEAAERFDPGRPGVAFATAQIARQEGRWLDLLRAQFDGYVRTFQVTELRTLLVSNIAFWLLLSIVVAACCFIALLALVKGPALVSDLRGGLSRMLPAPIALVVTIIFLLWPLVLPSGLVWLMLYWSALLWSYGSISERIVLTGLWLVVGLSPLAIHQVREQNHLLLSPPGRALESLAEGRLHGGLFPDVSVLGDLLSESVGVRHLYADLHRRLGQWEKARAYYQDVLEAEPENVAAMVDLGGYYFWRGDQGSAIRLFEKAIEVDPSSAAAYFDLNLAYSESYLFDESRDALDRARSLDRDLVTDWLKRPQRERLIALEGGIARRDEILDELGALWNPEQGSSSTLLSFRRNLSLVVVVGTALLALLIYFVRRRFRQRDSSIHRTQGVFRRWLEMGLPGYVSAQRGGGGQAFAAIWLPIALILLPFALARGFSVSWQSEPTLLMAWLIAVLGLGLIVLVRLVRTVGWWR